MALAILVAGLVAGACGSGSSEPLRMRPSPTTTAAAPAATTEATCASGVTQSMDGAVSGCLRVGALAPGDYHVVVDQVLDGGGTGPAPTVHLNLSPASGRPGTSVLVTGTLTAPSEPDRSLLATLCWGGCAHGLTYSLPALQWSATTFRTRFVVPAAPWLDPTTGQVDRLVSGTYTVEMRFLGVGQVKGQPSKTPGPDASGSFRLDVPASAARWCPSAPACGELQVSPGHTVPAGVVEIHGYLPLVSVIAAGGDQPFVYGAEVERGEARGPEVVATTRADVMLGHAPLRVDAAPTLSSLGRLRVVASQLDGLPPFSANPADPDRVAWCGAGAVVVEAPGGETRVPTAGVAATLAGSGLSSGPARPTCDSAALASSGSTVFAAFPAVVGEGEPATGQVGLYTTDGGRTWRRIPVPPGAGLDGFAGFEYVGRALEALFVPARPSAASPVGTPLVEETADAGARWAAVHLACPSAGPCAVLGAYEPGNCAMTGASQALLWSGDGGRSWEAPAWPSQVDNACYAGELVATASGLLLADGSEPYLLLSSSDGGRIWTEVAVPSVPGLGSSGFQGYGPGSAGLEVLPDGSLLVVGVGGKDSEWELLAPGATRWCTVTGLPAGTAASATSPVEVVGSQLWWRTGEVASHVALASLHC